MYFTLSDLSINSNWTNTGVTARNLDLLPRGIDLNEHLTASRLMLVEKDGEAKASILTVERRFEIKVSMSVIFYCEVDLVGNEVRWKRRRR
jgi:hypothetical protein